MDPRQETTSQQSNKSKAVFTIIEREGAAKNLWVKIGGAWVNRDGSIHIRLNALPMNGVLHVRDYEPED